MAEPALAPREPARLPAVALGLAIAGILLSPFLVGALFGLVGGAIGAVWLGRGRAPKGLATASLVVGVAGVLLSAAFLGIFLLVDALRGSGAFSPGLDSAAWKGRPAPPVSVELLDGGTLAFGAAPETGAAGRRAVVVFWATWCGPCRREIPNLNRLHDELGDRVLLVAISEEAPGVIAAARREHGIRYPIASARGLPAPFGDVEAIPTVFFLDERGGIDEVLVGYHGYPALLRAATGPPVEDSTSL